MINSAYQSVDREAIWAALKTWLAARLTAAPWAPSTAYTAGNIRVDPQGHLQKALSDGTSSAAAPTWNDSGGTTEDGSGGTAFTWQDTGAGVVSLGRKHKAPPDLTTAEQPALFVVQVMERHMPKPPGTPTKLALDGFLILYLQAPVVDEQIGAETQLGATALNALFYAIDNAFQPDNVTTGKFTIGGLVTHCWIEGETKQDPGILGPQAAAILPVHILVP